MANQAFRIPSPSAIAPFNRPIGHKPVGANDAAPLPKLGLLPAILKALTPRSAPVQQQAAAGTGWGAGTGCRLPPGLG